MSDANIQTEGTTAQEAATATEGGESSPLKRGRFLRKVFEFIGAVLFLRVKSGRESLDGALHQAHASPDQLAKIHTLQTQAPVAETPAKEAA